MLAGIYASMTQTKGGWQGAYFNRSAAGGLSPSVGECAMHTNAAMVFASGCTCMTHQTASIADNTVPKHPT